MGNYSIYIPLRFYPLLKTTGAVWSKVTAADERLQNHDIIKRREKENPKPCERPL